MSPEELDQDRFNRGVRPMFFAEKVRAAEHVVSTTKIKSSLAEIKRVIERSVASPPDGIEHLLVSFVDEVTALTEYVDALDRRIHALEAVSQPEAL